MVDITIVQWQILTLLQLGVAPTQYRCSWLSGFCCFETGVSHPTKQTKKTDLSHTQKTCHKNTLLRAIPTMTCQSYIAHNRYMSFLKCLNMIFFAFCLAYILTFFLASAWYSSGILSRRYGDVLSDIPPV